MNVEDWDLFYKIVNPTMKLETTQMVYEPRVRDDVFCMNFVYPCTYQTQQTKKYHECYTEEFVFWMFERELKYLKKCEGFSWAPEILEIDYKNKRIFFRWYGYSCNNIIFGKNLDLKKIEEYKKQIRKILEEQINISLYKLTMYPHCHYIDNNGNMRTFDFYSCFDKDNYLMELNKIKALLGDSDYRFLECINENSINLKQMYINTLKKNSGWPTETTKGLDEKLNW